MTLSLASRRTIVLTICGIALWLLVSQANHYLAPARLYIWVGGLFVTFAGLRLPAQTGFNACFLMGLWIDAATPAPFGLHGFLFGIAQLVLVRLRHRLAGEVTVVAVIVALLTNLALFLVLTFTRMAHLHDTAATSLRLLMDLAISQCALALLGPWFFSFQSKALEITGAGLRSEAAESI